MKTDNMYTAEHFYETLSVAKTSAEEEQIVLMITSYPPRECGIATYSRDLLTALNNQFTKSYSVKICALECEKENYDYGNEVKYILNTCKNENFEKLAQKINEDATINLVILQHEFGFYASTQPALIAFLQAISKPIIMAFHTVLPNANKEMKLHVQMITASVHSVLVMTKASATILQEEYQIKPEKINIIAHGTHLVKHDNKDYLKKKYQIAGRKVLSTFGLLNSGKSIETTLLALPAIVKEFPNVLFLIIGKTHPAVSSREGESYRHRLLEMVQEKGLENHVQFINHFLPLPELLEYLQLTDIYLFTSKDPHQAVSGTFSYAISCGCPVISTPIPHAKEVLKDDAGIIIDFENSTQLTNAISALLLDDKRRKSMGYNGLHRIASTAWENAAIQHSLLFKKTTGDGQHLRYTIPKINLDHVKKMTTHFGIIQFSIINQPDIFSGYTIDDNARAMVAMCKQYELTSDIEHLTYITLYLNFIKFCQQDDGSFLNYTDQAWQFTEQNYSTNLSDSNGRAIWALGYLVSLKKILPTEMAFTANAMIEKAIPFIQKIHSTRAMAFSIKGLYYQSSILPNEKNGHLIKELADRIVQMYRHESDENWNWFESYLTYANSILPEALLCAWLNTGDEKYKTIALSSFNFLLKQIFSTKGIAVISNKDWLHKSNNDNIQVLGGEQPIDVAYTILALSKFYDAFGDETYKEKMKIAFDWFLGNNHLNEIIYNPCTGGCYDGLEDRYVNLNQGAESTVSYLMARLTIEKYFGKTINTLLNNVERLTAICE